MNKTKFAFLISSCLFSLIHASHKDPENLIHTESREEYGSYHYPRDKSPEQKFLFNQARLLQDRKFQPCFNLVAVEAEGPGMGKHATLCALAREMRLDPQVLSCDALAVKALALSGNREAYALNRNGLLLMVLYSALAFSEKNPRLQQEHLKGIKTFEQFLILNRFSDYVAQMSGDPLENLGRSLQEVSAALSTWRPRHFSFFAVKLNSLLTDEQRKKVATMVPETFWMQIKRENYAQVDLEAIFKKHLERYQQNDGTKVSVSEAYLQEALSQRPTIGQLVQNAKLFKIKSNITARIGVADDEKGKGRAYESGVTIQLG